MSKKVVLFFPKPFEYARTTHGAPLGLLAISRILDKEGYDIKVISEITHHDPLKEVLEQCKGATCFALTAMTGYQIIDGLKFSRAVKEKYPNLPIVWGGWHPSILPRQTLENKFIDILIVGQGDRTFPELVHALESKTPLNGVPGILFKENGKIVQTGERPFEDLNNFPALPYHLVDFEKSIIEQSDFGKRTINYVSSYGCPFQCGFCAEQTVNKRRWTGLKAERVLDEIEHLVKTHKIDSVGFIDTNFFVDRERVRKICQGFLDRKLGINWASNGGRADQLLAMDDELWQLMKDSGLKMILIGAESGWQRALDYINKGIKVETTFELAKRAKKFGIKLVLSWLIGLPWETKSKKELVENVDKEFSYTIKAIRELVELDREMFKHLLFFYTPYPGAPLYGKALKLGLKQPQRLEDWAGMLQDSCYVPWIGKKYEGMIKQMHRYYFVFLFPSAKEGIGRQIKNPLVRQVYNIGYDVFDTIVNLRWKHQFYALPIDYWLFSIARKYSPVGS